MEIDREQILESCLETIRDYADKSYQKRVWVLAEGPECDSYTESACFFFHDVVAVLENYKKFNITDKQYIKLKELKGELEYFSEKNKPIHYLESDFIDIPEWNRVVNKAKEVLKAFRK